MTEPAQHPMNPEQEIRLHAINLATALHKDAFRIREAENADPGDAVVRDAARFAAFVADGTVSGESAGALIQPKVQRDPSKDIVALDDPEAVAESDARRAGATTAVDA